MNKGLKSLKELRENVCYFAIGDYANPRLDIIEKELKEKDELAQALSITTCENGDLLKYKKALEIIIGSGLNLEHCILIANSSSYEDYVAQFDVFMRKKYPPFRFELRKSKEQFDLLKEVLL